MVSTLIIWAYILTFSYLYGFTIIDLFVESFHIGTDPAAFPKTLIILTGLFGINTLAAYLSLFLRLAWLTQLIFLLVGIGLAWRMWKKHAIPRSFNLASIPKLLPVLFLLAFLTVLEYSTHSPSNPDTGIYQAQAIRWIETYPAVPGLGDLHSRFAYNSNWLVINAFFSIAFLGLQSFHVLPGIFLVVTLIYFIGGTHQLLQGKITPSSVAKTLFIPLVFYIWKKQISSPGTDFPASLGIWITVLLWLDLIESEQAFQHGDIQLKEILIFLFPFYFFTIKLSSAPLLLLSGFILSRQILRKRYQAFAGLLVGAILILLPWFARNLILSGYWIFPVPALSFLSPNWDWKIPLKYTILEQRTIQAWARIPGADINTVLASPISWMKDWFLSHTRNQELLIAGAMVSPVFWGISSLFVRRKIPHYSYFTLCYLASFCGLAFWLFTAPDIRFGFGFIVSTLLLAVIPALSWVLGRFRLRKIPVYSLITFIILYQLFALYASIDFDTLKARLILPEAYPPSGAYSCPIVGYDIYCAKYYNECFYDPFPCVPYGRSNTQVELRGKNLSSGFRFTKERNPYPD